MPSGGTPGSPDVAHMLQSLLQQVFGPNFRPGQTGDGNEQQQGQQGRPNVFVSMGGANNAAEGENIGSQTPLLTITQILQRAFGDNTQGNNTTANLMNLFQMVGDPRDYAWGPGGLDQIITQLLEQQAARTAPPPAPEDIINNLPRSKITKKQVVEEQLNCPVCKEDYSEGEEVVSLPCNHAFHDDCIKPWLKMNGTCPVCRYSLVKQESEGSDQNNDDGSQNGHNTNANANSNLPSSSSGGGAWFLPGSYPTQQQDGRRNDNNANHDILDPESMD
ncbi:4358_t:CDS:2 [Paraglomus brasilianum]|uniref:RING-type E3 ubiquitin transferase n=1 Tax=Paraglomus brasilianum TaxID=144538 RepID=A0A9N9GFV0_9GLOM|nr:4358_t:CDS:2 [Paraglomus brasilianum]